MASKPIEVHPLADQEASEAYDYYEQRDARVSERFKKELERCLAAIEVRPLMFTTHLLRTRRCLMVVRDPEGRRVEVKEQESRPVAVRPHLAPGEYTGGCVAGQKS